MQLLLFLVVFLVVGALVFERCVVIFLALREGKIAYWPITPIINPGLRECKRTKNPFGYWLLVVLNSAIPLVLLYMVLRELRMKYSGHQAQMPN